MSLVDAELAVRFSGQAEIRDLDLATTMAQAAAAETGRARSALRTAVRRERNARINVVLVKIAPPWVHAVATGSLFGFGGCTGSA